MQNARDTFYVMLRNRIATGNAARTMVVRGVLRPSVLVVENELVAAVEDGLSNLDAFCLSWKDLTVDLSEALPLVKSTCEISYGTAGTAAAAGMDRGRSLATMDAELSNALRIEPRTIVKTNFAATPASPMGTNVFWGDPVFGAETVDNERLERVATVAVYSYQEAGEV